MGDRADAVVRTRAVLGRRGISVLAVGVEAVLVVVELGVLDDDLAAGVGPRVAECVELAMGAGDRLVAPLLAGADVVAGVAEVAGVRLRPRAPGPVAREDPVLRRGVVGLVERARRAQIRAVVTVASDLAAAVAAVPPDLVARVALAAEEIAGGEILDPHIGGLPHHDPVESSCAALAVRTEVLVALGSAARWTRLGPVDDHRLAVHAAQVHPRRSDQYAGRRVGTAGGRPRGGRLVVARPDQDPVARSSGVDRGLD